MHDKSKKFNKIVSYKTIVWSLVVKWTSPSSSVQGICIDWDKKNCKMFVSMKTKTKNKDKHTPGIRFSSSKLLKYRSLDVKQ